MNISRCSKGGGPLRFRGQQEQDQGLELLNLEQQAVSEQETRKGSSRKKKLFTTPDSFSSWNFIPAIWFLLCILYLGLITTIVCMVHSSLPTPVTLNDTSTTGDGTGRFVAARAQADLHTLIRNGPRPVGSKENEEFALNFLRNEIFKIIKDSNKKHTVMIADQVITGSFDINQQPVGYISFYHNVQNIIVRLSSNTKMDNSSAVLVNCHFDSVPGSPGASDDAFHCAVMLELLRILSQSHRSLLHDIIFLFNGAEESGLQASHGFITHHGWAKDVRTFVNLEACGAGGKEILFQTGPSCPWLVETYAEAVPHPHGTVMAEELFQSGVIPSDTDFRIFRDFGLIPGVDFANSDNGFVYHTKFDNGALVPLGSFQHTGDNILALLQALATSPLLHTANSSGGSMVYFDFLGLFFVRYSQTFGLVFNFVVSLLSLGTIVGLLLKIKKAIGLSLSGIACKFGCAVTEIFGGWILSAVYIFFLTMCLNWLHLTQSWYRDYFYLVSLYYCPTLFFCVLTSFLPLNNKKLNLSTIQKSQINSLATQLVWTILLVLGTALEVRSSYLFLIQVLCPSLCNIGWIFFRNHRVSSWVMVQLLHSFIPSLIGIYHTIMAMNVFIPITNRSGSGLNAELAIGILSAVTCIMNISYLVSLSVFVRHLSVIVLIGAFHLVGLLILLITQPLPFYTLPNGESGVLQRVPLWHVERTLYDEQGAVRLSDSGFWMMNMDCSSPYLLKSVVSELKSADQASSLCETELFCGLPLYSPRMSKWINNSLWIPASKPFERSILQMNYQLDQTIPQTRRITFNITGPNQMSFMFSPLPGVTAARWSLEADLISYKEFKGRPAYFVFYQRGLPAPRWTFHIDFQVDASRSLHSKKVVTVGLAGSEISRENFSSDFKRFIDKFPDWAFVYPRASELKIWEI